MGGSVRFSGFIPFLLLNIFGFWTKKPNFLRSFPNILALFTSQNRARDEKFGKNEGVSQIFEFYCIFINKYFWKMSKNLNFFSVVFQIF